MTPLVLVFGALVVGIIVGAAFVFGTPIIGIPVALIAFGLVGAVQSFQRLQKATSMKRFRDQSRVEKTDFTDRDRQTMIG